MNNQDPKQIIVVRKDLKNIQGQKIRTGKILAQACHASLGAILNYVNDNLLDITNLPEPVQYWLNTKFTKVVVTVNSEEELLEIYQKALDNNINVKLIQDCGLTEFGNVPTYTALALGPDLPEVLDPIAHHLPLL